MTMHCPKVSEKIALLSHALLRSCSEKRYFERKRYERHVETVKTIALTRSGERCSYDGVGITSIFTN